MGLPSSRIRLENGVKPYYSLNYATTIDGIELSNNISTLNNIQTDDAAGQQAQYAPPVEYPMMMMEIADDGSVMGITCRFLISDVEPVQAEIEAMDFTEAYDIFKTQMKYKFFTIDDQPVTIKISKIRLSYCLTRKKDAVNEYLIIPVWNFIGPKYSVEGEPSEYIDDTEYSYLKINAMDGSIFDVDSGV